MRWEGKDGEEERGGEKGFRAWTSDPGGGDGPRRQSGPTSLAELRPGACRRDCQFFNPDPALAKYSTATFV